MPSDSQSQVDQYYEMLQKQKNYPMEEHIITYAPHELMTLKDVENDRYQELLTEDK